MPTYVELDIIDDHIALITLNRPGAANALSAALLHDLNEVIDRVNHNRHIYCTIITGAGEKAFCAGADLKERRGMTDNQVISAVRDIGQTATNIEQMTMPCIAALNGAAFGGGLELALACDFRIAANHSKMGLTETSLAIIPGAGGTQRLPRTIGISQAKRLIYTAKRIDASEALNIGLVEKITDQMVLLESVKEIAHSIIKNGPIALQQAKSAINQGLQTTIEEGLEIEHRHYVKTIPTQDRMEGLAAFQDKRKPIYKGE